MANELIIEGVIGGFWGDVSSADVRRQLKDMSGDVDIIINSIGGDVFDGLAMFNQIRRYDAGQKRVIVDGIAASAASMVAMAGDTVLMGTGAQLMVHRPWTMTVGNDEEHDAAAAALRTARGSILDTYSSRIDDRDQLEAWVDEETWFGAEEAVAAGFADGIEGAGMAAAIVPADLYRHTPAALVAGIRQAGEADALKQRIWQAVAAGHLAEIERRRA